MIKRSCNLLDYCFLQLTRTLTTCSLLLDPPPVSLLCSDHKSLCLSLADQLIRRRLLPSAQQVVQCIISSFPISDVISATDFAAVRGLDLDFKSYCLLVRKLVESGEHRFAESLYTTCILGKGVELNPKLMNSMVICYCSLAKFDEAIIHFDKLIQNKIFPSKLACYAILRELYAQGRILEAFEYLVVINDAGIVLGLSLFDKLIGGLCHHGYLDEALYLFDIMHSRTGFRPTAHLYKSLIYGLCQSGRGDLAEMLCADMEAMGLFVDKTMYTSLVSAYCTDKKLKMAMRICFRMLKTGCIPDTYTINTLIHGFFNLGLFEKGWILHNLMADWGIQSNAVTYHIMINQYCKEKKVDCALAVLNSMKSCNLAPTVHCYTSLIGALSSESRWVEVEDVYRKMLDGGVTPDHVLFFVLLKRHQKGHELQLALRVLQAISLHRCSFDPFLSSVSDKSVRFSDIQLEIEFLTEEIARRDPEYGEIAFGIFISALCERGKIDSALLCVNKMISLGCSLLLSTCNSLIKCLFLVGIVDDVKPLVGLMQDQGILPNLETYLIMVHGHCKRGDLSSAFDVLDEMDEKGIKPNVAIYDSFIGCLSRERRIMKAENMFKRMLESGVDPDEVIFVTMINGYSKNGWANEASQLFDQMIQYGIHPSARSYTALINGLVKKNKFEKGSRYLDRMWADGFMPNVVLCTSLTKQFLRKRDLELSFRLVDLMERNHIGLDLVTHIVLVSGMSRNISPFKRSWYLIDKRKTKGRNMLLHLLDQNIPVRRENALRVLVNSPKEMKNFAFKLVQSIKDSEFMPNLFLYNGMISVFCRAGRMEEAYHHLELMKEEGINPNHISYTILIDGYIRVGEIDRAVGVFNKMNACDCIIPDRVTYNTLLRGLCKASRLLDALSLSFAMHKRGFVPNKASYEFMLNSFCTHRLSSDALKIFKEMLSHRHLPCCYNWNLLLCVLCEEKKLDEAYTVLKMMRDGGKSLYRMSTRSIVEACYKEGLCSSPLKLD